MDQAVLLKLDSLRELSLMPKERAELASAQERLRIIVVHPLECVRELALFMTKELSSFLDLVINRLDRQEDLSYVSELWEYVDVIESICDRRTTTECEDNITGPASSDYQFVERRKKGSPSNHVTSCPARQPEVESEPITIIIGKEVDLAGLDDRLEWPG